MGKLDVKIEKAADKLVVQMAGTIDEDVDFSQFNLAGNPAVEVELSNIKSINSCGIREWIKWIGTAGSAAVTFNNCPKVIVDQINMVDGFLPATGRVQSFFVPYYNDDAGSEKNVLFRYGTEFSDGGVTPPAAVKDDDGNEMEMDVIESKYFKFLNKK
ncbi:hypothetical protein [Bdellovibrio svalbardensis]|uniref:Uncharacterized protein n=1 Tax=Bdellovibrio svalbardensis TaxID=2972972 RepID=A0ABT6DH35_9BACT|nr:hypothetical protein [Bdellovibrio svalbardensis]MDG0816160.1 hypothetical protein [Bdellovibrio svalbardensis]